MNLRKLLLVFAVVLAPFSPAVSQSIIPAPPQLAASGYLLIDADTETVLVMTNGEQRLPPASLTKLMTSYVAASEIARGRIKMDDMVNISVRAWKMEGSRMFVQEGSRVSVSDLLRGVIVQSGNDASVALAEHIAGSEEAFVDVMNQHAQRLGMVNSHFMNATGLPDENHYMTARDLATLTIALIRDYPEHYAIYAEKYFTYNNIRQPNRNSLLWRDTTVDGVKTGHTEAAGYCLVSSATRDGMRLVSVVMGTASEEARAAESQKLLTYGFRYFETVRLYEPDQALRTVRVWRGESNSVDLGLGSRVVITIPRGSRDTLVANLDITSVIKAPFEKGAAMGQLVVSREGAEVFSGPLVALTSVPEAGFFKRVWHAISLFFGQILGWDLLTP